MPSDSLESFSEPNQTIFIKHKFVSDVLTILSDIEQLFGHSRLVLKIAGAILSIFIHIVQSSEQIRIVHCCTSDEDECVCDFRTRPTAVYRVGRSVCPAAILLQLCHGTVREKVGSAGGQIYGGVQPNLSQSSAPNRKPNISSEVSASQGTRQLARRYYTIAFQTTFTIYQKPKPPKRLTGFF